MIDDLAADEGKTADDYLANLVSEFEGVDGEEAVEVAEAVEAESAPIADVAEDTDADDKPKA
ncbi:hypothetical protein D3C81_1343810 [compost metagenome]